MDLSERIKKTELSVTVKIADKVRELERKGEKIIKLQTGEPHFPTPNEIKLATIKALKENKTHYSHSRGIFELRNTLCQLYNQKFEIEINPYKNILITPGAKQAILYFMLSILNERDEVIIPTPSWMTYAESVKIAGGTPVFLECDKENGFELFSENIKDVISNKTKAVLLNNPNNPTGKIISKETLQDINHLCIENDILLVCDEIYDRIIFHGFDYRSILSINPKLENVVYINGFSKTYSMAGWRLGYVIADEYLINSMLKVQQTSVTNPTTFIQYGAVEALKSGEVFVQEALIEYQGNKDILLEGFKNIKNFDLLEPEGAIYAFIDISKITNNSEKFSLELLEKCKVSTVPGIAFGKGGEDYIRICFATEKEKLIEFMNRLKETYL